MASRTRLGKRVLATQVFEPGCNAIKKNGVVCGATAKVDGKCLIHWKEAHE